MNNLNAVQLQDIRNSAYELASNVIDDRGISDRERDEARKLAAYLVDHADEWASFDLDDMREQELDARIAAYFGE